MTESLIRDARLAEGLTQAQLARRLGISQPSVARLERAGDAVTVATLRRTLAALGRGLELRAFVREPSYDETLLYESLKLTPAERLAQFERFHRFARDLAIAGEKARGAA